MKMRLNWICSLLCLAGMTCYLCGCVPPPERSRNDGSTSTNTTGVGSTTTDVYYDAAPPAESSDIDYSVPEDLTEPETSPVESPDVTAEEPAVEESADENAVDEPTIELMPPEPSADEPQPEASADVEAAPAATEEEAAVAEEAAPTEETAAEPEAAEPMEEEAAAAPEAEAAPAEAAPEAESGESEPAKAAAEPALEEDAAANSPAADGRVVAGDWPMWGGSIDRNMVNSTTGVSLDFEPAEDAAEGKKVLWTAKLGSQPTATRSSRKAKSSWERTTVPNIAPSIRATVAACCASTRRRANFFGS